MDKDVFQRIISYNMKVERLKREWTQADLAEHSGVSLKHITKIECKYVLPSIYIVYKIASAFDIPIDELLKEPDKK